MTPSETTEAGTALGMTTQTSGRSTNKNTMPENLGTTSVQYKQRQKGDHENTEKHDRFPQRQNR